MFIVNVLIDPARIFIEDEYSIQTKSWGQILDEKKSATLRHCQLWSWLLEKQYHLDLLLISMSREGAAPAPALFRQDGISWWLVLEELA